VFNDGMLCWLCPCEGGGVLVLRVKVLSIQTVFFPFLLFGDLVVGEFARLFLFWSRNAGVIQVFAVLTGGCMRAEPGG